MLLETLASTGGYPKASRVGKVTRVPEPTTALMAPATAPAASSATASQMSIARTLGGACEHQLAGVLGPDLRRLRGVHEVTQDPAEAQRLVNVGEVPRGI